MASEVEVEKLMTTLGVNTKDFEKGMKSAQDAVKDTQKVVESSGKELQGFYKELKELASSTQSGIEAIGAEGFFKSLTAEIKMANNAIGDFAPAILAVTRPVESAGKSLTNFSNIYDGIKKGLGDKGILEGARDLWTKFIGHLEAGVAKIVPAIQTGFAAATSAVVGSVKAMTAAIVASPLVFVVAAAAIVSAVALIVGAVMKFNQEAEKSKKLVEGVQEFSSTYRKQQAQEHEADQAKADTLRGDQKISFDEERLAKVQKRVENAVKARKEVEARILKMQTLTKTDDGYGYRLNIFDYLGTSAQAKVAQEALKARREEEAQQKEARDSIAEELLQRPMKDVAQLHKALDMETSLVGLKGTSRELKKVEMGLERIVGLAEFYEDLGWDDDIEEVGKLNEAIEKTTKEVERYKEAIIDNKAVMAIQATKDAVTSLNHSLEEQVERLKYTGDEWELYNLRRNAALRGAPLGEDADDEARVLIRDKKILEQRKKWVSDAEQFTKRFASPTDKFREQMTDLMEAHRENPLDEETFSRAAQQITKEFNNAERAAAAAQVATQKFNAALVGSGEAAQRMAKYREEFDIRKLVNAPPAIQLAKREKTADEQNEEDLIDAVRVANEEAEAPVIAAALAARRAAREADVRAAEAFQARGGRPPVDRDDARDFENRPLRADMEEAMRNGNQNMVDKLQEMLDALNAIEENSEAQETGL